MKKYMEVCRGNTASFEAGVDDHEYITGDVMTFVVKEQPKKELPVILEKQLEYDGEREVFILSLAPEDTADLECYPDAVYYYDVGYELESGEFYTIVQAQELRIMPANAEKSSGGEA